MFIEVKEGSRSVLIPVMSITKIIMSADGRTSIHQGMVGHSFTLDLPYDEVKAKLANLGLFDGTK